MNKKNLMNYKGYFGSYELSEEDGVFFGKVEFIKDLVSYEGETAKKIIFSFHQAVDDYIKTCKTAKKEPERPFKGSFNIRVGEELHRLLAIKALEDGVSINRFIKEALKSKVS